jgi:hypothetical protein
MEIQSILLSLPMCHGDIDIGNIIIKKEIFILICFAVLHGLYYDISLNGKNIG